MHRCCEKHVASGACSAACSLLLRESWLVLLKFPRRPSPVPQRVQLGRIPTRVHAHPETLVLVNGQLPVGGKLLQWPALQQQLRVVVEIVLDKATLEEEEPPLTHPSAGVGFSLNSNTDEVRPSTCISPYRLPG